MSQTATANDEGVRDFIRDVIRADLASGKHAAIVTRFLSEPSGSLHSGSPSGF